MLADGRPLSRQLTTLLADACADFAPHIGFIDIVQAGASSDGVASVASSSSPTGGPRRAQGTCPLYFALEVPEELEARRTRTRRSTQDAGAQRAAAATFNPAQSADDFVDQTPVPLSWFLFGAASAHLDDATIALVLDFYHHCNPDGGDRGTISLARLTSPTADPGFRALQGDPRSRSDCPLLRLFRDGATRIAACVWARSASEEDRLHMACSAFQ